MESDFATDAEGERELINAWVAQQTDRLIPESWTPGSFQPETVMVLVNAVALDAPWEVPFNPEFTHDRPFTRVDGTVVDAATMYAVVSFPSAVTDRHQAIELP